jgi:ankyrin repeat protein
MDDTIRNQRIELNPAISYTLALHSAIRTGNRGVVAAVLDAGADVNWRDAYGQTALFVCSAFDSRDGQNIAADLVLARPECDIEIPDRYGITPLENAKFKQRPVTAKLIKAALSHRSGTSKQPARPENCRKNVKHSENRK